MFKLRRKNTLAGLKYTITHRPRVTRRMHMETDNKGELVLVVPRHWSRAFIHKTLVDNQEKVERFLAHAQNHPLKALQYVNGERHFYLGKQYPLVVSRIRTARNCIKICGDEIHIHLASQASDDLKKHLQSWYAKQAGSVFHDRLQVVCRSASWLQSYRPELKLRRMKRTWGNCSSKGVIKLNTHLVKAPVRLIDSVIAHEVCHLEEMNHGAAFYALLEKLNPRWREDRAELRTKGRAYLLT